MFKVYHYTCRACAALLEHWKEAWHTSSHQYDQLINWNLGCSWLLIHSDFCYCFGVKTSLCGDKNTLRIYLSLGPSVFWCLPNKIPWGSRHIFSVSCSRSPFCFKGPHLKTEGERRKGTQQAKEFNIYYLGRFFLTVKSQIFCHEIALFLYYSKLNSS